MQFERPSHGHAPPAVRQSTATPTAIATAPKVGRRQRPSSADGGPARVPSDSLSVALARAVAARHGRHLWPQAGSAGASLLQRVKVLRYPDPMPAEEILAGADPGPPEVLELDETQVNLTDYRIINFSQCSVRMQNPHDTSRGGDPRKPNASKVTDMQFSATETSVDRTIGDYHNSCGTNIKLWLDGAHSLWYSGARRDNVVDIVPQENLAHSDTMVTIILPTAKVEWVSPSWDGPATTPTGRVLAHGLQGTITPEDRIWTTLGRLRHCLDNKTVFGLPAGYCAFQLLNSQMIALDLTH